MTRVGQAHIEIDASTKRAEAKLAAFVQQTRKQLEGLASLNVGTGRGGSPGTSGSTSGANAQVAAARAATAALNQQAAAARAAAAQTQAQAAAARTTAQQQATAAQQQIAALRQQVAQQQAAMAATRAAAAAAVAGSQQQAAAARTAAAQAQAQAAAARTAAQAQLAATRQQTAQAQAQAAAARTAAQQQSAAAQQQLAAAQQQLAAARQQVVQAQAQAAATRAATLAAVSGSQQQAAAARAAAAQLSLQSAQQRAAAQQAAAQARQQEQAAAAVVRALQNQQQASVTAYQMGRTSLQQMLAEQRALQQQALQTAQTYGQQSTAYRQLTATAQAAQRAMDQSRNRAANDQITQLRTQLAGARAEYERAVGAAGRFNQAAQNQAARQYAQQLAQLRTQIQAVGQQSGLTAQQLGNLNRLTTQVTSQTNALNGAFSRVGLGGNLLNVLRTLPQFAAQAGGSLGAASAQAMGLGQQLGGLATMGGPVGVALGVITAATVALTAALTASAQAAISFEAGMAKVSTLMDQQPAQLGQVGAQILDISRRTGAAAQDLQNGLYDIMGAAVKGTESQAAALTFLEQSTRLAIAGMTQTSVATDVMTSVMNAYKLSAADAGSVSDKLFKAVDMGKMSFEQLAQSLGMVTAVAASAGVSLDETLAALATMTANGVNASSAVDYLRSVISSILKPSEQASKLAESLGIQFDEQALKAKGLTGVLRDVMEATDGNTGKMAILFGGVEALTAATSIAAGEFGRMEDSLDGMESAAGSTDEAYNKVAGSTQKAIDRMKASFEALKVEMGTGLLPGLEDAIGGLTGFIDWLSQVSAQAREAGQGLINEFQPYLDSIAPIVENVVASVVPLLQGLYEVVKGILGMVAAIFGATFQALWPLIQPALEMLTGMLRASMETIGMIVKALGLAMQGDFKGAWETINTESKKHLDTLVATVNETAPRMLEAGQNLGSMLLNGFDGITQGFSGILAEMLANSLDWVKQNAPAWAQEMIGTLSDVLHGAAGALSSESANSFAAAGENWAGLTTAFGPGSTEGVSAAAKAIVDQAFKSRGDYEADNIVDRCARWVRDTLGDALPAARAQIDKLFRDNPGAGGVPTAVSAAANFKRAGLARQYTGVKDLKPGDTIFYVLNGQNHVGTYVGDGMVRGNNRVSNSKTGNPVGNVAIESLGTPNLVVRADDLARYLSVGGGTAAGPRVVGGGPNGGTTFSQAGAVDPLASSSGSSSGKGGGGTPPPPKSFDAYIREASRILTAIANAQASNNADGWRRANAELERFQKTGPMAAEAIRWVNSQTKAATQTTSQFGQTFDRLSQQLGVVDSLSRLGESADSVKQKLAAIRDEARQAAATEKARYGETAKYVKLLDLAADAQAKIDALNRPGSRSGGSAKPQDAGLTTAQWDKYGEKAMGFVRALNAAREKGDRNGIINAERQLTLFRQQSDVHENVARFAEQEVARLDKAAKDLKDSQAAADKERQEVENQLAQGRIDLAQQALKRLEAQRERDLKAAGNDAAAKLRIEETVGKQILEARKAIAAKTRDLALAEADKITDTALKSQKKQLANDAYDDALREAQDEYNDRMSAARTAQTTAVRESSELRLSIARALTDGELDLAEQSAQGVIASYRLALDAAGNSAQEKARVQEEWAQRAADAEIAIAEVASRRRVLALERERNRLMNQEGVTLAERQALWKQYADRIAAEEAALGQTVAGIQQKWGAQVSEAQETASKEVQEVADGYKELTDEVNRLIEAGEWNAETQRDVTAALVLLDSTAEAAGVSLAELVVTQREAVLGATANADALASFVRELKDAGATAEEVVAAVRGGTELQDAIYGARGTLAASADGHYDIEALRERSFELDSLIRRIDALQKFPGTDPYIEGLLEKTPLLRDVLVPLLKEVNDEIISLEDRDIAANVAGQVATLTRDLNGLDRRVSRRSLTPEEAIAERRRLSTAIAELEWGERQRSEEYQKLTDREREVEQQAHRDRLLGIDETYWDERDNLERSRVRSRQDAAASAEMAELEWQHEQRLMGTQAYLEQRDTLLTEAAWRDYARAVENGEDIEAAGLALDNRLTEITRQGIRDREALDYGLTQYKELSGSAEELVYRYEDGAISLSEFWTEATAAALRLDALAKSARAVGNAGLAEQFERDARTLRSALPALEAATAEMRTLNLLAVTDGNDSDRASYLAGLLGPEEYAQKAISTLKSLSEQWRSLTNQGDDAGAAQVAATIQLYKDGLPPIVAQTVQKGLLKEVTDGLVASERELGLTTEAAKTPAEEWLLVLADLYEANLITAETYDLLRERIQGVIDAQNKLSGNKDWEKRIQDAAALFNRSTPVGGGLAAALDGLAAWFGAGGQSGGSKAVLTGAAALVGGLKGVFQTGSQETDQVVNTFVAGVQATLMKLATGDMAGAAIAGVATVVATIVDIFQGGAASAKKAREEIEQATSNVKIFDLSGYTRVVRRDGFFGWLGFKKAEIDKEAVSIAQSLGDALYGAVSGGMLAGIQAGKASFADVGADISKRLGEALLQSIVDAFIGSAIVQEMLQPYLDKYIAANKSGDAQAIANATQEMQNAIVGANSQMAQFYEGVLVPVSQQLGVFGQQNEDGAIGGGTQGDLFGNAPSVQLGIPRIETTPSKEAQELYTGAKAVVSEFGIAVREFREVIALGREGDGLPPRTSGLGGLI